MLASHESCDVNAHARDREGDTPLHAVARLPGNIESARVLMSCDRIRSDVRNKCGHTPLDLAYALGEDAQPLIDIFLGHKN